MVKSGLVLSRHHYVKSAPLNERNSERRQVLSRLLSPLKMSSAKRRQIVKLKKSVQDKLRNIQEQREILNAIIDHYVSEVTTEAESLLSVSDPTQFMQDYMGVMLNLDKCYNGFEIIIAETENLSELPDKFAKPICDNFDEGIASKASSDPSLSGDISVRIDHDVANSALSKVEPYVKDTVFSGVSMSGDADVYNDNKKAPSVNERNNFDKPFTDKHLVNITDEDGLKKRTRDISTGSSVDSSHKNLSEPDLMDVSKSTARKSVEKSNWKLKDAQPRVDVDVARRFLTRILNTNEQHNKETIKTRNQDKHIKTESVLNEEADIVETETKFGATRKDLEDTEAGINKQKFSDVDSEISQREYSQESKLAKNIEKPVEGMSCLAKFSKDNVYYRAKVTNVYSPGKDKTVSVDVVFVDYGNGERRKCTDLRELPVEFSVLPTQAICCAVAKVAPANKYGLWTEGDILYFRQFVSNQQFNCIPVFHSKDPDFPHLIDLFLNFPMPALKGGQVFMQPSFTQVSVFSLLVNQGCAKKIEVGEQLQLLGMPADTIKSPFKMPASEDGNSRSKKSASEDGNSRSRMTSSENKNSRSEKPTSEDGNSRSKKSASEDGNSRSKMPATDNGNSRSKSDEENMNYNRDKEIDVKNYSGKEIKNETEKPIQRNTNKRKQKSPKKESKIQSNKSKKLDIDLDNVKKEQQKIPKSDTSISSEPSHESYLQMAESINSENEYNSNPKDSSLKENNMNMNQNNLNTDSQRNINNNNSNICEENKPIEETNIQKVQNISSSALVSDDQVSSLSTESETVNLPLDLSFGGQSEELSYLYNQGHKVMLSHIESPDSFYVHIGTEFSGRTLDKMMKSLNKTFEQKSKKKLLKLSKSFLPAVNELCCAQFSDDNCYYRVLITEVKHFSPDDNLSPSQQDTSIQSFHVFYIDFGNHEWVKKKRLFPLPEEYKNVPPLAIHCGLAYIRPSIQHKDNLDNAAPVIGWSADAVSAFCSLTNFDTLYDLLIVSGNLNKVRIPEKDNNPIKVLLVDNTGSEEICVNMDLIHAGVAMIDTSHTNQDSPPSPEAMLNWDPMMEDYLSIRNSYKVDVDDAGVATVGYKAQDEKRICKYFQNNTCWRGERCPYRHVQTSSDTEPVFGGCIDHQEELLPDAGSWVAMEISTIMNPGHFYIILPWGNKSIDILSKERASEVSITVKKTLVTVIYYTWLQVFYVDFGNREWVPETTIRQMEPEFLHLPFQAIESFLLDVEPVGQQWSKEARQTFRELVDGKTLVAHVKQRSWNGCLWMEIFDTTGPEDISVAKALIEKGLAQEPSMQTSVDVVRTRKTSSASDNSFIFVPVLRHSDPEEILGKCSLRSLLNICIFHIPSERTYRERPLSLYNIYKDDNS
ncbi:hypothetical protein KUTeg_014126 [Tegillarca granosa]|uniref:Uncharacterized protein n=1 Tax=Tegillarca granosa TaxID=220873 RepID=A0ABQ9F050_TEGGR|nr:hypothetical protein KUTeg_014126 [Tegillarca granosa]